MVVHDRTRLIGPLFLILFCLGNTAGSAGESKSKSLADEAFVVETTDEDASESLNRVSGTIDLGIAAPSNVYKSENHYGAGPFADIERHDRADDY